MTYGQTILDTGTAGRTYATLAQAEAALPALTTGDGGFASIQLHDDSVFTDKNVLLSHTNDGVWGHYEVIAAPGKEWKGTEGSGVVMQPTGAVDEIIDNFDLQLLIHGIEFDGSAAASVTRGLTRSRNRNSFTRCAFHDSPNHGWYRDTSGSAVNLAFNAYYNNTGDGCHGAFSNGTLWNFCCVAVNNDGYGIWQSGASRNRPCACAAFGNLSGDYFNVHNFNQTNSNIAGDATLPANRNNLNSQSLAAMNYVDAPNGDFHVTAGSLALQRGPTQYLRSLGMTEGFWTPPNIDMDGAILDSTMLSTDLVDTGAHQRSWPPVVVATVPTPVGLAASDPVTDGDLIGTISNSGDYVSGDLLTVHLDSDDSIVGGGDAFLGTWEATGLTNDALQTLKLRAHRSAAISSVFSATIQETPTAPVVTQAALLIDVEIEEVDIDVEIE